MLTNDEEKVLADINKLIDWYQQNHKPVNTIRLDAKRYNIVRRIEMKIAEGEKSKYNTVEFREGKFRGFEIVKVQEGKQ